MARAGNCRMRASSSQGLTERRNFASETDVAMEQAEFEDVALFWGVKINLYFQRG